MGASNSPHSPYFANRVCWTANVTDPISLSLVKKIHRICVSLRNNLWQKWGGHVHPMATPWRTFSWRSVFVLCGSSVCFFLYFCCYRDRICRRFRDARSSFSRSVTCSSVFKYLMSHLWYLLELSSHFFVAFNKSVPPCWCKLGTACDGPPMSLCWPVCPRHSTFIAFCFHLETNACSEGVRQRCWNVPHSTRLNR